MSGEPIDPAFLLTAARKAKEIALSLSVQGKRKLDDTSNPLQQNLARNYSTHVWTAAMIKKK